MYRVATLEPLSLVCNKVPITRSFTGPLTPTVLPIQINVTENLDPLQFFIAVLFFPNRLKLVLIAKEIGFNQIELKFTIKTSKNVMR